MIATTIMFIYGSEIRVKVSRQLLLQLKVISHALKFTISCQIHGMKPPNTME